MKADYQGDSQINKGFQRNLTTDKRVSKIGDWSILCSVKDRSNKIKVSQVQSTSCTQLESCCKQQGMNKKLVLIYFGSTP